VTPEADDPRSVARTRGRLPVIAQCDSAACSAVIFLGDTGNLLLGDDAPARMREQSRGGGEDDRRSTIGNAARVDASN
jgi:hypothetical protein